MNVESCLYEGRVRHRRFAPVEREFTHRIHLAHLRLDQLDRLDELGPAVSSSRRRPMWFDRSVHLGDPNQPLDEAVLDLVESRLGRRPAGPVTLLAHLRTAGACFNPLAAYYCYSADDPDQVDAVVLQVTNTPWREQTAYVVDTGDRPAGPWHDCFTKAMHVSPFLPMDLTHRFRGTAPGERLHLGIDDLTADGDTILRADLVLRRRPLDGRELARLNLRHPLMTWRVSAGIHAQALRLAMRRVPFHRHPRKEAA